MSIYTASVPVYRGYTFPLWSIVLGWCLVFSSVAAVPIVAIYTWCCNNPKTAGSVSPSKSPRKLAGESAGESRNSATRKSPAQQQRQQQGVVQQQQCNKTISVNYSSSGAIQSGLSGFGQMSATNVISSLNDHRIKEDML